MLPRILLCTVVALGRAGVSVGDEWPCYAHDPAHTSLSNDRIGCELVMLWDKEIGRSTAQPVVAKGKVYVGTWSGRFLCLDAETGNELWHFDARKKIGFAAAVDSGIVVFGSDDKTAYARLMKGLGDEAAYGKAAYLAAKHLLSWYAHFFGTDYLALYMGRDHTSGANRFRHLVNVLPEHLARKTDIIYDTKVTGWVTTHGPSPEGDPTLFLAPWTGILPLAHDEMHRFWRDHMKGEIGVVWDFFTWLWPETFNQFSADQMNNWGGITPYYQLKAFVLDGAPDWLAENLPWPEVTQDPYYLQNLRAILFAAGAKRWIPLLPSNHPGNTGRR